MFEWKGRLGVHVEARAMSLVPHECLISALFRQIGVENDHKRIVQACKDMRSSDLFLLFSISTTPNLCHSLDPIKLVQMWIKTAWSGISRSATVSWERSRTRIGQLPDNVNSWFKKLPPVTWFDAKFPGWQGGVVAAIAAASLALAFNLVFLILAMQRNKPASNGVGTILEGDCGKVKAWNQGSHAFINIMSTVSADALSYSGLSNHLWKFSFSLVYQTTACSCSHPLPDAVSMLLTRDENGLTLVSQASETYGRNISAPGRQFVG